MGNTNNKSSATANSSSLSSSKYAYYWSSINDANNNNNNNNSDIIRSLSPSRILQTVIGATALLSFILVWFASIGSPILGLYWFWHEHYFSVFILVVLTLIAYLPWGDESTSNDNIMKSYARISNLYYKKCIVIFQKQQSLPSITTTTKTVLETKENKDDNKQQQQQQHHQPLLYAVHPHGAFCLGWSVLFCSKIMNDAKVQFCFSPVLFTSPLFRLWSRLTGTPGSADKSSMINYMTKKKDGRQNNHLALPPGGFEEATLTCRNKDRVYIKKRTGFVKLALQHGYNIVPVYTFGENQTYDNIQGMWNFRLWLNKLGIPAIVVFGSWFFPILPKRDDCGLRIVVGEPVVLPTISNPSREEVKHWHDKYITALTRIFEEHKEEYYGPEVAKTQKLEVW
jgi:hypothetical protein